MIIVSQDKSIIVNFNSVEAIEIGNPKENQFKGTIYARLMSDYFYKIGEYKTEERAKEVLQEIVKAYQVTKALKICENRLSAEDILEAIKGNFVFEMPLE